MPFLLFFIPLLFIGCSQKPLVQIPQDPTPFVKQAKTLPHFEKWQEKSFNSKYFSPWDFGIIKYSKHDALWAWRVYRPEKGYYGENRLLRDKAWFETLKENASYEEYATLNKKAITITNASLRNLPTNKPIFRDFKKAGEGYPFDYGQNSRIHAMQPVRISHYTKDGVWALVQSAFSIGWIEANKITTLTKEVMDTIREDKKIVIIDDNIPITNTKDEFVMNGKLGMILPLHVKNKKGYESYRFIKDKDGKTVKQKIFIKAKNAKIWPLEFSQPNLIKVNKTLLGELYGWGGLFENRDCSAMTKDFLASFGIWLPRNSAGQKSAGEYIKLKGLEPKKKEDMIKKYATPFLTLLYLKGHIMLYAGVQEDKNIMLHNTWGVRTTKANGEAGRAIIGKTVLSDLYLGQNRHNVEDENLLIARVEGATLLSPKHALTKAYPQTIEKVQDNKVFFKDGSTLIYDDFKEKTFKELLTKPDIEDQFKMPYPTLYPLFTPEKHVDPGRVRNQSLFHKLYGKSQAEIESNLVHVDWLPSISKKVLSFNKMQGAAASLQKVSNELDKLPPQMLKYLDRPYTYIHRKIAGTNRLSMHSFGIAIDVTVKYGDYWRWSKDGVYKNQIPERIVHIFEKNGFIWGGRWNHFDTLHFEYRPELTQY